MNTMKSAKTALFSFRGWNKYGNRKDGGKREREVLVWHSDVHELENGIDG